MKKMTVAVMAGFLGLALTMLFAPSSEAGLDLTVDSPINSQVAYSPEPDYHHHQGGGSNHHGRHNGGHW